MLLLLGLACGPGNASDSGSTADQDTGTTVGAPTPGTTSSDPDPTVGSGPTGSSGPTSGPMPSTTSLDGSTGSSETGPPVFPEHCSLLDQDCPPGYKCNLTYEMGQQDTRCVEVVDDPQAPGEPCSVDAWPPDGDDDCDATSSCVGTTEQTLMGTCWAFCIFDDRGDVVCAEPCEDCIIGGEIPPLCAPTCDPLAPACDPGQICVPSAEVFICTPDGSNGAGTGDPCEFINACSAGHACLNPDAVPGCMGNVGCCAPYCDPADDFDPCPGLLPGSVCEPWYRPGNRPLPECGYAPPGVCVTPQP